MSSLENPVGLTCTYLFTVLPSLSSGTGGPTSFIEILEFSSEEESFVRTPLKFTPAALRATLLILDGVSVHPAPPEVDSPTFGEDSVTHAAEGIFSPSNFKDSASFESPSESAAVIELGSEREASIRAFPVDSTFLVTELTRAWPVTDEFSEEALASAMPVEVEFAEADSAIIQPVNWGSFAPALTRTLPVFPGSALEDSASTAPVTAMFFPAELMTAVAVLSEFSPEAEAITAPIAAAF